MHPHSPQKTTRMSLCSTEGQACCGTLGTVSLPNNSSSTTQVVTTIPTDMAVSTSSFCGACFQQFQNGSTVTNQSEPVLCGADGVGSTAEFCSGATRADVFGTSCRSMCAKAANKSLCHAGAVAYCAEHPDNRDCACLAPERFTWDTSTGTLSFADLTTYMTENPALAGSGVTERCFWPACWDKHAVLPDPALMLDCPSKSTITCLVEGVNVTLNDVQANKLNIVSEKCGGGGVSGASSGGSIIDAFDRLSVEQKVGYGVGTVMGLLLLASVVVVLFIVLKNRRLVARAEALAGAPHKTRHHHRQG